MALMRNGSGMAVEAAAAAVEAVEGDGGVSHSSEGGVLSRVASGGAPGGGRGRQAG